MDKIEDTIVQCMSDVYKLVGTFQQTANPVGMKIQEVHELKDRKIRTMTEQFHRTGQPQRHDGEPLIVQPKEFLNSFKKLMSYHLELQSNDLQFIDNFIEGQAPKSRSRSLPQSDNQSKFEIDLLENADPDAVANLIFSKLNQAVQVTQLIL